ncbi:chymotrypsin-2-like [Hyposmocoma kahamanoa]|uniref:chymotrypsin-2-like n=1 Tax=Hyposmocoma kahamanoa TaxID=1477025 RepID=UPI000E6D8BE9|nr:chymotrypsin-2-like [Hyposmocoma kahamanoa]
MLMTYRYKVHVIQSPLKHRMSPHPMPGGSCNRGMRQTCAYRVRPILLRRIGCENTSSSLIRSAVSFALSTASQKAETAFHALSLSTIALTTTGSDRSLPTTEIMLDRTSPHAGHSVLLPSYTGSVIPTFDIRHQDSRVVGGEDAPEGGIPYQVSLRTLFNSHFCGGSILSSKWVLTAAHCTVGESRLSIRVVVGTNDLTVGGDRYSVDTIIIHSNYDEKRIKNDISLLKVSGEISFNDKVQPIQLPEVNTEEGANLMLSGWGRTSDPGNTPTHLQMINLTALSVETCQGIYVAINPVYDSQVCTLTRTGQGACYGDSGGPLVENKTIVGVVSWGMPCARGYPDVYTRVFAFKDWILKQISSTEAKIGKFVT